MCASESSKEKLGLLLMTECKQRYKRIEMFTFCHLNLFLTILTEVEINCWYLYNLPVWESFLSFPCGAASTHSLKIRHEKCHKMIIKDKNIKSGIVVCMERKEKLDLLDIEIIS